MQPAMRLRESGGSGPTLLGIYAQRIVVHNTYYAYNTYLPKSTGL